MRRVAASWSVLACLALPAAASAQIATWTGTNSGDRLGISVGSAGDFNGDGHEDYVVGIPNFEESAKTDRGIARVYSGASPSVLLAVLRPPTSDDYDFFGYAVSSAGDVYDNGSGAGGPKEEVIVGAPVAECASQGCEAEGVPDCDSTCTACERRPGKAYVFYYNGSSNPEIAATPLPTLSGVNDGDFFGAAVASGPSIIGSGKPTVVVGALGDDGDNGEACWSGRVYAYEYNAASGTWDTIFDASSDLTAGVGQSAERFGRAVLVARTGSGGNPRVVVGAPYFDSDPIDSPQSGRVLSLRCTNSSVPCALTVEKEYRGENARKELFGYSLASIGDVNDDAGEDLVVGAPYRDHMGAGALVHDHRGAVYLVSSQTGAAFGQTPLEGESSYDYFGYAVATIPDVSGDGIRDVLVGAQGVGAPGEGDFGEDRKGRAYIYALAGTGPGAADMCPGACMLNEFKAIDGEALENRFGFALAGLGGDVNNDGVSDFLTSAPEFDDGGGISGNKGKAYLFSACESQSHEDEFETNALDLCKWTPTSAYLEGVPYSPTDPTKSNGMAWQGDQRGLVLKPQNYGAGGQQAFVYKKIESPPNHFVVTADIAMIGGASNGGERATEVVIEDDDAPNRWISAGIMRPSGSGGDFLLRATSDDTPDPCNSEAEGPNGTPPNNPLCLLQADASVKAQRYEVKIERTGSGFEVQGRTVGGIWKPEPPASLANANITGNIKVGFRVSWSNRGTARSVAMQVRSIDIADGPTTILDERFDDGRWCDDSAPNPRTYVCSSPQWQISPPTSNLLRRFEDTKFEDANDRTVTVALADGTTSYIGALAGGVNGIRINGPRIVHTLSEPAEFDVAARIAATNLSAAHEAAGLAFARQWSTFADHYWVGIVLRPGGQLTAQSVSTACSNNQSCAYSNCGAPHCVAATGVGSDVQVRLRRESGGACSGSAYNVYKTYYLKTSPTTCWQPIATFTNCDVAPVGASEPRLLLAASGSGGANADDVIAEFGYVRDVSAANGNDYPCCGGSCP